MECLILFGEYQKLLPKARLLKNQNLRLILVGVWLILLWQRLYLFGKSLQTMFQAEQLSLCLLVFG